MLAYARPKDLAEALSLAADPGRVILAGGTDLFPATRSQRLNRPVLDIGGVAALRGITATPHSIRIGACTPWAAIAAHDGGPGWTALAEAALQVGGVQIQSSGTIGGNLCNASPAADGVPPLLALDASVEIASGAGLRVMPLAGFILGPRKVALEPGEVLTAVLVPTPEGRSRFLKLGARAHLVISISMAAARLVCVDGRISAAALAVGACGPVSRRLTQVEAALVGPVEGAVGRIATDAVAAALSPIDDVRATAGYRADAAAELVRRAVSEVLR